MLANAVSPARVVVCALGATLAGWVCGLLLFLSQAWQPVELAFFDRLTVATAPRQALPITLVLVDKASVGKLGQPWPWSREVHARLVDKLAQAGAAVIAFDLLFSGPAPGDEQLAQAIRSAGAVVLASDAVYQATGNHPWKSIEPLAALTAAGAANGRRAMFPSRDGIVRLMPHGADTLWRRTIQAFVKARPGVLPDPYVQPGSLMRHLGPAHTFAAISYHQVLNGDPAIPAGFFADQIVLVGVALDMAMDSRGAPADSFATPFTRSAGVRTPAVEIQATMIESALMGQAITTPALSLHLLMLTGALALLLPSLLFWKPVRSTAAFAATALAVLGAAVWQFSALNLWVAIGSTLAALLVAFVAMAAAWSWSERRGARGYMPKRYE